MPRCNAGMPRCKALLSCRGAAAMRSKAARGCRDAQHGCEGPSRWQHGCRGAAAMSTKAARGCRGAQQGCEGPPRCPAWLPRCCRDAKQGCEPRQGCEGLPMCAAWLRGAVAVAAWLPRCCRDEHQGCEGLRGDAEGMPSARQPRCRGAVENSCFHENSCFSLFCETRVTPCQMSMPTFVYIRGNKSLK